MTENEIRTRIQSHFPNSTVTLNGEGCSFEVQVQCASFQEIPRLERQQSILKLFFNEIQSGDLHSLSVKTSV